MLSDLERGVDTTQNKLDSSLKRLRKFIRDNEGDHFAALVLFHSLIVAVWVETKSGWCIAILIVILLILFIMVILI